MFTHKDLIPIAYSWVLKRASCGVAFKELNTNCSNKEYPDVIGFSGWGRSVLIEVKISRSDFLNDKKKSFRKDPSLGMGLFRFFMCPTGLIATHELPEGWGLIYVAGSGRATCVNNPYCKSNDGNIWNGGFENRNIVAEHGLMVSALRRLHIKGQKISNET